MAILHMNAALYRQTLAEAEKPVLVEFWAPWCTYCRRLAPALAELTEQYANKLIVGQINVDEEPALEEEAHIELIPTLMLYQGGKLLGSVVAPESKAQLEAFIEDTLQTQRESQDAPPETLYDMIIVGGGPGGYTAALYAARAGLNTLVIEKISAGGQMALSDQIDNYPGFENGIDGFTLGQQMQKNAERFGAKTQLAEVLALALNGKIKKATTSAGVFYSKTVVFATGAAPRELGLPDEAEWTGRGIHYCAACDGMFYKDKTVVVVGGGNTAVADALLLARICKKVILVHRRSSLRATHIYHEPLMQQKNVEFCWNCMVTELLHDEKVTGVRLKNVQTGEEFTLACDGVFVGIGRKPATELAEGQLELDSAGYVLADASTRTNIPGVFAVGDVRTKDLRQVVTAVADGAIAVHEAEAYLAETAAL